MEKILILGTAPDTYIHQALEVIRANNVDAQFHLMVNTERAEAYRSESLHVIPIQGKITWNQWPLFSRFIRLNPQKVILVRGQHWFHDNVVRALVTWTFLGPKPDLICMRGGDLQHLPKLNGEDKLIILAVFSILLGTLLFPWTFTTNAWIIPLALIMAELGFRAFENMYQYMGPLYQKTLTQPRLHKTIEGNQQTYAHPRYGWVNIPRFHKKYSIQLQGLTPSYYEWSTEHDANGHRLTSDNPKLYKDKPEIAVFGCSISYGFAVDSKKSFPWLLQEHFQDYRIGNYGVGAWSLHQMNLLLDERLKQSKMEVLLLGFHQELELRATNSFPHRTHWLQYLKSPACVIRDGVRKEYPPEGFHFLPFSDRFRTLALIQYGINRLRYAGRSEPRMMRETTETLLLDIKRKCEHHGVRLLVACIDNSEQYYRFFKDNDFSWVITGMSSQDLARTLYPFDGHPNGDSHQQISEVLVSALEKTLKHLYVTPEYQDLKDLLPEEESSSELRFIYPQF